MLIETNITKAIRKILLKSFADYKPDKIEDAVAAICLVTGRVDYRKKYVDMCHNEMARPKKNLK